MTTVLIAGLVVLSGYLAARLGSVRSENETLRAQVASLKRQLVKRRS
jgi:hypothetical protein